MITAKKAVFALPILLVVIVLCSFLPATAFAGELHSVQRLEVVDANGKLVGEVIDFFFEEHPLVAFKKEGKLFMVAVSPSAQTFFGYGAGGALYYESTDCSGAPFVYPFPFLILPTVVNPPGMTVYVPDTSATPQEVNFNSLLHEVASGGTCDTVSSTDFLVPAVPLVDLASVFTPPFSVRGH